MVYRKANLTQRILSKGGIVADYLNAADPKRRHRMLNLIEPMQRLAEMLPEVMRGRPAGHNWEGRQYVWYNLGQNQESASLIKKINLQLRRYIFRRQLPAHFFAYKDEPPGLWTNQARPEMQPPPKGQRAVKLKYDIPILDEHVVALVLDVAEAAALNRIRLCSNCGKWFMAHRSDQEYCSGECSRESYYKANKENWPEYQKKFRRKEKLRQRRSQLEAKVRLSAPEKEELGAVREELKRLDKEKEHGKS